ncbi:MAG: hypothetical protein NC084_13635, partial [Bacteroides sp.]|nr:hypothetical protein [Roseburia sp.]MCM1463738.1 hypothetical protein [Bacteroides sp.]
MYTVSNEYREAIAKRYVTDRIAGTITLADGTELTITDGTLVKNSLKITHELCGEYKIGTFRLGCLRIAFFDDNALLRDFTDAKICPVYEILTEAGWESVPMGIYYADGTSVRRKRDTVSLTAYDGGIVFDRVLSEAIRGRSATAEDMIAAACEECGAVFGGIAEGLTNTAVKVGAASRQIQTYRDLIGWCAALLCAYAVIDRTGALRLIPAKYGVSEDDRTEIITDKRLSEAERDSIYVTDTRAYIATLHVYHGGTIKTYLSDTVQEDEQAAPAVYTLAENPILLETLSDTERDRINESWLAYIDGFKQRGIEAEIYGDPALDVGDVIRCSGGDVDQRRSIVGLVTRQEWRYRNFHTITCATPQLAGTAKDRSVAVESQTEKRLNAASSTPYTAGQGITVTGQEIGLKVAGKGSYYNGNWQNLIGGVYIDTMTTGSANSLNVDSMGILRLLPAKVGTIGGVSPGMGLRRSSASSSDNAGAITVNIGKGLSLTKKSSYNSTYDSGYEITPKLGEGLYFDDDGKINVLTSDESGGGGAGYVIKAQGINIYAENYLN